MFLDQEAYQHLTPWAGYLIKVLFIFTFSLETQEASKSVCKVSISLI